jgi:hypothetical protein
MGRGQRLGTDCPYFRAILDALIDFRYHPQDKDAMVVGLTLDWPTFDFPEKEELSEFILDYFIEYPLMMVNAKLLAEVVGKEVNMIQLIITTIRFCFTLRLVLNLTVKICS